jgi:hypothetical protein
VPTRLIGTYAPGTLPQVFREGTALRLEPGGVIELQMHYTTNGEATTDRMRVGIVFSKDPAPREVRPSAFFNGSLSLPPNSPNTAVPCEVEFQQDTIVYGLFPHTHLRGKAWEYSLVLPDGTSRKILSVPRYDFNWQREYAFAEPMRIPAGSKLIAHYWYDNSKQNPANPDPKATVKWGDQTFEEMMIGYIDYYRDAPAAAKAASVPASRDGLLTRAARVVGRAGESGKKPSARP